MAGEAQIVLSGNLGEDAILKKTPTGKLVTSFSVCNTPSKNVNGEWQDGEAIWFRCFVWGKDATGAANELRKGMRVTVSGRLTQQTWTDKEGNERKSLEVAVDEYGIKPRNVTEPVTLENQITEDPVDDPWA